MELLSKKELTTDQESDIRQLLDNCIKYGHTQAITEIAISIRRKYGLKLPDAIIAATAVYVNIPLLTADKQFSSIDEIDCYWKYKYICIFTAICCELISSV